MKVTRDAIVVTALAAFLFFVAVNLQAGWMYAVDTFLVGVLVAAAASAVWSVRGLQISRSAPGEVHEGDRFTVTLEVRSRRLPRFFLELSDLGPAMTGHRARVPIVWPGRPVRVQYRATALRRGLHAGGTTTVASSGLAGWFWSRRTVRVPSTLTVLPRIWRLAPLRAAGRRDSAEPVVARAARAGLEVYGVRDYREGDSLRHVHWRSTARRGQLVIREYERDAQEASVLLLDTRSGPHPLLHGGEEVFEDLVRAVASVADAMTRTGQPVRVIGSVNGTPAEAGPSHRVVMRWLAAIEPFPLPRWGEGEGEGAMPPARVYEAVCVPGTPVVVFTADPGSVEYFAARDIPCTAVVARGGDDLRAQLEGSTIHDSGLTRYESRVTSHESR
jgi:uncharacterized protein (DUF58 family)